MRENTEQEMIKVLRSLPIAVVVTKRTDAGQSRYIWQCLEGAGTAMSFSYAANQALCFLIGRIASPLFSEIIMRVEPYMHDWQEPENERGAD